MTVWRLKLLAWIRAIGASRKQAPGHETRDEVVARLRAEIEKLEAKKVVIPVVGPDRPREL